MLKGPGRAKSNASAVKGKIYFGRTLLCSVRRSHFSDKNQHWLQFKLELLQEALAYDTGGGARDFGKILDVFLKRYFKRFPYIQSIGFVSIQIYSSKLHVVWVRGHVGQLGLERKRAETKSHCWRP